MLKTLARQGLRAMREYANEMLSALSDPQAISSFMAQLPSEEHSAGGTVSDSLLMFCMYVCM